MLFCSRRYGFDDADVLLNNTTFRSDIIYSCATARTDITIRTDRQTDTNNRPTALLGPQIG